MMGSTEKKLLKIGEVARLTGLPAKTIRYYEERGLVEPAARTRAGYRLYGEEEVSHLEFVKRAKLLGITLEEIAELVSLTAGRSHEKVMPHLKDVLEANLKETERKMAELAAFRDSLFYYRILLFEDDPRELPLQRRVSFCARLEAVPGEGRLINTESLRRRATP